MAWNRCTGAVIFLMPVKGGRTIWHPDNLAPENLASDNLARENLASENLAPDNLAPEKIGTRTIWHRTIWHRTIWHQGSKNGQFCTKKATGQFGTKIRKLTIWRQHYKTDNLESPFFDNFNQNCHQKTLELFYLSDTLRKSSKN